MRHVETQPIDANLNPADPMHSHPLFNKRFDEATPDEFKKFWEAAGWIKQFSNQLTRNQFTVNWAERTTIKGWAMTIDSGGLFEIGEDPDMTPRFFVFGEAYDAIEELVSTRIFGGWAAQTR
jgi:hypothetical protein